MKKTGIILMALCLLLTAVMGVVSVSADAVVYGDVDGNGKINNKDLGRLQQYLNDWDVTLGPEVSGDDNIYNDTELDWT